MSDQSTRLTAALSDCYRIERELGQGGMATVYLAHDLKHDRKVAVKVLRPELAAVIGAERFLAEIKTTANLQHPHILSLFDPGTVDGTVFYVMPFVTGKLMLRYSTLFTTRRTNARSSASSSRRPSAPPTQRVRRDDLA
jgi:serine/threonine protein kinase